MGLGNYLDQIFNNLETQISMLEQKVRDLEIELNTLKNNGN